MGRIRRTGQGVYDEATGRGQIRRRRRRKGDGRVGGGR